MNSTQTTKRISVGDRVTVEDLAGVFEVIDTSDPALYRLKTADGVTLRAGYMVVRSYDARISEVQS